MQHRLIVIALAVLLAGAGSGYALGGYATGGADQGPKGSWWSSEAAAADSRTVPISDAPAAADTGPGRYVCKGCGPTLAERQAQSAMAGYSSSDAAYDRDYAAAQPAYHSVPQEASETVSLPDLGRTAY
ncbi:MAG: hypothetical protein QM690_00250 [Sphingobium sp.]